MNTFFTAFATLAFLEVFGNLKMLKRRGRTPLWKHPEFPITLALEFTNLRTLDRVARGEPLGAGSSGLKIRGSELQQAISEAQVELGGLSALPWLGEVSTGDPVFRTATQRYNFLRACTIYGGSTEIQKNLLAKLLLGTN